ncbi:V-set and immunoglobulin domain-containing protein 8b [Girardinichthys multiradiatus]|uniref:V-set and immunoglobulin domain-containing protein 8b n=1 Tax=Girardinichthys multiradiatus TaxID=208333 RepID=UPI001FAC6DF9|nr:V-set and immunoglobulin domain-containing protein 8b [Girardinichthys multiradiatus]
MDPRGWSVWLKVDVLLLIAIQLRTEAMVITSSGPQTIQKAEGETVNLGCTYTPGAEDKGDLDIEWSSVSPDMTQKDKLILSYTVDQIHHYDPDLSKRINLLTDPKQGDASISISAVRASDTGTYQCKIKKAPGVDMRKVTLVVQVPPSVPKCWVEGGEEKGATVSLRCKSSKGSIPLTYVWKRETGGAMPTTATQDAQTGELLIKNHTEGNTGTYVCEAKNGVGEAQCKYTLHAYNPTDKVGVIVGAVIGALLLLLLLLFLIWLLVCCCHKKRYQKEAANEIREDAPAPESRPSSRLSSFRSVTGYNTHQGLQYTSVGGHLSSINESGPINPAGSNAPSTVGDRAAPLKYDHQYGYAV